MNVRLRLASDHQLSGHTPRPRAMAGSLASLQVHESLLNNVLEQLRLEGRTMTEFVLHSAEEAAERTIATRAILMLTARDTETFVDAVLNPPRPGPVLRAAARRYNAAPPDALKTSPGVCQ